MNKILITSLCFLPLMQTFAQNQSKMATQLAELDSLHPVSPLEFILPIAFISFLILMLIHLVKYFLEFRLKNKLIDKGMAEQLSSFLSDKNEKEKQNESIKLAILFCGMGLGLLLTYFSSPVDIHSLAIMFFSLGLSYLVYFYYLKKQGK